MQETSLPPPYTAVNRPEDRQLAPQVDYSNCIRGTNPRDRNHIGVESESELEDILDQDIEVYSVDWSASREDE